MFVSFHSKELPLNNPVKWTDEYNTVKLILEFVEVDNIKLEKWGRMNVVTTKLQIKDSYKIFEVEGVDCKFSFRSKWINFYSINPYLDE